MSSGKSVILTACQPTGGLHLGNLLGAIQNWVAMQDEYECYFPIVDMHAITLKYDPAELRRGTIDCVAEYMACGLDPQKCHIFAQSHVIGHAELAWVLGSLIPVGQLHRMTQFKEKSANLDGASIGSGLLNYPILMAADILLYNADLVPVGDDQKQHIELTRDVAEKFNRTYSETLKVPEPFIPKTGARIMSLQEPDRKMAKSDPNQNGVICLLDPPGVTRKKIMSAVTDSGREVVAREDKPGITNLLNIMSSVTGRSVGDLEGKFEGVGYGEFKRAVAEAVAERLQPIQESHARLISDRNNLVSVLLEGQKAAQKKATETIKTVYRKVGFLDCLLSD